MAKDNAGNSTVAYSGTFSYRSVTDQHGINLFWKRTIDFHSNSKHGKGVHFPTSYKKLEELKALPIFKSFFEACYIYANEHLRATDGISYLLTNRRYCYKNSTTTEVFESNSKVIDRFWKNTERFQQQSRQEVSSRGLLFPSKYKNLNALKNNPFIIDFLHRDGINIFIPEHLWVTDGEGYLLTSEKIFFRAGCNFYGCAHHNFVYSVDSSLFSKQKQIILTPRINSKWTGKHVISSEFIIEESYINSKFCNIEQRAREYKREKEEEQLIKEKKLKLEQEKVRKKQEAFRKQQQQRAISKRLQDEKTAREEMPPPNYCTTCGESDWRLKETSPNIRSAMWECRHCNKSIRILSKMLRPTTTQRAPIPKNTQREVWRRDQGCCVECGCKENIEFDHIIPVSKGGANTVRNIQLLCQECNRAKSNKDPGES